MANVFFSSPETSQMPTLAEVEREMLLLELTKLDDVIGVVRADGEFYSDEIEKQRGIKNNVSSEIDRIEHQMHWTENTIHDIWEKTIERKNELLDSIEEEQTNRELIEASNEYSEARIEEKTRKCDHAQEITEKIESAVNCMVNDVAELKKKKELEAVQADIRNRIPRRVRTWLEDSTS